MQYPILTTDTSKFVPNPSYTIVPTPNPNVTVDNFPVVTSFTWQMNEKPYTSGTYQGDSQSTSADNLPVVLAGPNISTWYTVSGSPSVLSD